METTRLLLGDMSSTSFVVADLGHQEVPQEKSTQLRSGKYLYRHGLPGSCISAALAGRLTISPILQWSDELLSL